MALSWDQFHRMCSRYQFVKWVWKVHFWNYIHFWYIGTNGLTKRAIYNKKIITCYWFRVSTCFTYSKEWNQLPCCLFTVYSICYVSHCRVLALPNRQRGSFLWRSLLNSRSRWSSLRPVFIKLSQSTRTSNRKLISLGIWYECSTHCILTHWSWVMHMRQ